MVSFRQLCYVCGFLTTRRNAMESVHNGDFLPDHNKRSENLKNKFSAQTKTKHCVISELSAL